MRHAGAVKRVGRCDSYATEFDLEAEEYVPLPKGDVHKKKEIVQVRTSPQGLSPHQESEYFQGYKNLAWIPAIRQCAVAGGMMQVETAGRQP